MTEKILRALTRAPESLAVRAALRWRYVDEAWYPWLRRSADAVHLAERCRASDEYREMLGADAYQEQLLELLARAGRRDCAAAGLGCTRRLDRSCREPAVCVQDPAALVSEGPAPGGCDTYHGGDDLVVRFSPGDRHRAVLTRQPVALWIDGVPVITDQTMDFHGRWLDDRHFAVQCEGPDEHPAQSYGMGPLFSKILTLLIVDADQGTTTILVPGPEDLWTAPWPEWNGDGWTVRPDRDNG
jgi:hypothetical protein